MCAEFAAILVIIVSFIICIIGIYFYEKYSPELGDVRIVELENGKFAVEKYTFCGMDETGTDEWVRIKEFNSFKKAQLYKKHKTPKAEIKVKRVIK